MVFVLAGVSLASPLVNGSFENNNLNVLGQPYAYSFQGVAATGWTFTNGPNGGAGVQANGSAWGFSPAPNGIYTAFLQQANASVYQTFYMGAGGQVLHFDLEQRGCCTGGAADSITVSIAGNTFGPITPSTGSWTAYTENFVNPSAGLVTLTFTSNGVGTNDVAVGLDSVRVPEPSFLLMLFAGLASVVLMVGASRRKLAF